MPRARGWPDRIARSRAFRWSALALLVAAGLLLSLMVVDVVADRPLRRYMEGRINAALTGYSVSVGEVDLHVLNFSIDLEKVTIYQDAYPIPPVAELPYLHASVQWQELFSGHLVGDVVFDQPVVHIDLAQLSAESRDETPLHRRGWQDALAAIYPLKINALEVYDATVLYQDEGDYRPLRLSHVHFHADNIRNVKSGRGIYPSEIHMAGQVFDYGFLVVDGAADFLAEDFPAVRAHLRVSDMDLEYFDPVARRINFLVKGGWLGAWGEFEFAKDKKRLDLEGVRIEHAHLEYFHTSETAAAEEERRKAAAEAAKRVVSDPETLIRIRQLDVIESEFGYRNDATSPSYRIFLSESHLALRNFSSAPTGEGPAVLHLSGRFMGEALLRAQGEFREGPRPDFSLSVALDEGRLTRLNDLLKAYAKLDVAAGRYSVYTEMRVKDGMLSGYVKPLFHDVDVYDPEQDKHKNIFKKAYEAVVGGVAKILKNRKRDETATVTTISGPVENIQANTLEIIGGLLRNAFFDAILPGFEGSAKRGKEPRDRGRKSA